MSNHEFLPEELSSLEREQAAHLATKREILGLRAELLDHEAQALVARIRFRLAAERSA